MINYEICCSKNFATMEKPERIFLKFLPKQSNFKSTVATTDHYKRIFLAVQHPLTEAYIRFCAFLLQTLKTFFTFPVRLTEDILAVPISV